MKCQDLLRRMGLEGWEGGKGDMGGTADYSGAGDGEDFRL